MIASYNICGVIPAEILIEMIFEHLDKIFKHLRRHPQIGDKKSNNKIMIIKINNNYTAVTFPEGACGYYGPMTAPHIILNYMTTATHAAICLTTVVAIAILLDGKSRSIGKKASCARSSGRINSIQRSTYTGVDFLDVKHRGNEPYFDRFFKLPRLQLSMSEEQ